MLLRRTPHHTPRSSILCLPIQTLLLPLQLKGDEHCKTMRREISTWLVRALYSKSPPIFEFCADNPYSSSCGHSQELRDPILLVPSYRRNFNHDYYENRV